MGTVGVGCEILPFPDRKLPDCRRPICEEQLGIPISHFKSHRDTEKAEGMFGTLIVQLPSQFTGGDLVVGHSGKNEVIEMAQCGSDCYCLFAAFYSDCELNTR